MNSLDVDAILSEFGFKSRDCEVLIFQFFISFARMEHRLVEEGSYRVRENGDVEVDWDKFVNCCVQQMPDDVNSLLKKYLDFLNNDPPKKLVVYDNEVRPHWGRSKTEQLEIDWRIKNGINISDFGKLTIYLRRVRNNLFHGGKMRDSKYLTLERMRETLPILADLNQLLNSVSIT